MKIDMAYTRKHKVLRILVGCLNHTKIPRKFPLFIKDGIYCLSFYVEGEDQEGNLDVIMADNDQDHDGDDEDIGEDFQDALKKDENANPLGPPVETGSGGHYEKYVN